MASEREVKIVYTLTDNGTIKVLRVIGEELDKVKDAFRQSGFLAEQAAAQVTKATDKMAAGSKSAAKAAKEAAADADKNARDWEKVGNRIGAGIGAAVAATATAVTALTVKAVGYVNALDNLSKSTGVNVKLLSSLRVAAIESGVSVDQIGRGIAQFDKQLTQAAGGGTKATKLFDALGVSARTPVPALGQLADLFARLPDGPEKSAVAIKLFGEAGTLLIPILNRGSAGLKDLQTQAELLGVSIDEKTAASFVRLRDRGAEVQAFGEGLAISLVRGLVPQLTKTADETLVWAEANRQVLANDMEAYGRGLGKILEWLTPKISETAGWLDEIERGIATVIVDAERLPRGVTAARLTDSANQRLSNPAVAAEVERLRQENLTANGGNQSRPSASGYDYSIDATGPPKPADYLDPETQARIDAIRKALATVNKPTGAEKLANLADKSLVDAQKAEQVILQTNVDLFNDELDSVRKRIALEGVFAKTQSERLALLDRSESAELEIARQIDAAKGRELDAEIAVLEARKQNHDVIEAASKGLTGQLDLLNAQEDSLKVQKQLLTSTSGEAAKVTDAYAKARAEIVAAKREIVDLTDTIDSSLQRAVNGILAGGGQFDLGDIFKGTGEAIASEFIGGFIKAKLAKEQFDLAIGDNFTVTLPGFMKQGVDSITSLWSDAMNFITGSAQNAGSTVGSALSGGFQQGSGAALSFGNTLSGISRDLGSTNPYLQGGTITRGADGRFTVTNAFDERFSSANASDAIGAASGSPQQGGSGGGGIGLGLGLAAATYGASIALDIALNAHQRVQQLYSDTNLLRTTLNRGDIGYAAGGGGIVGGIGRTILNNFNGLRGGIVGAGLASFDPISALIAGSSLFNAPTGGTQRAMALQKILRKLGLPQQGVYSLGEGGIRAQFLTNAPDAATAAAFAAAGFGFDIPGLQQPTIEQLVTPGRNGATYAHSPNRVNDALRQITEAARQRPGVEALRTNEALGLGLVLTAGTRRGVNVANLLTNNLLLTGVSEGEARRQLLKIAESQGVTLPSGIEEAQRLYIEKRLRDNPATAENEAQTQLFTAVKGLVGLFKDDIPAGVDVTALAVKHFTTEAGIDIDAFNKELERQLAIFGQLQATVEGGLKTGLDTAGSAIGRRDSLLAAGGPVNEIIKANLEAKDALSTSLFSTVSEGMRTAIVEGVLDAVKETPAWKALTEAIAAAVKGGDVSNIPDLIKNAVNVSLPVLEAALEGYSKIQSLAAVTPSQLSAEGESLRQQAEGVRYGQLSTRDQQKYLRDKVAKLDAQIASIEAGGITPEEAGTLQKLLEQRGTLGQQFIDLAGNYAPDSLQSKQLIQFGLNLLDTTAQQFTDFGISQRSAIESNTAVITDNTNAVKENTEALKADRNQRVAVGGGPAIGGNFPAPINIADTVIGALTSPQGRAALRASTRAR